FPSNQAELGEAGAACTFERPIDEPEAPMGNLFAHVQVGCYVADVIVQCAFARRVQIAIGVSASFEFAKEPALEPTIRVWIVVFDDVPNTHQDTSKISEDGIECAARVMRGRIPVTTDEHW